MIVFFLKIFSSVSSILVSALKKKAAKKAGKNFNFFLKILVWLFEFFLFFHFRDRRHKKKTNTRKFVNDMKK